MAATKFNLSRIASTGSVSGKIHGIHTLHTNDAVAVIETDGYLDAFASQFEEGKGDILHAVFDVDGTVGGKSYVVTRTSGDIALTAFS